MDYEKKYNEALERARKYMDDGYTVLMPDLFPELRESEDERIRKAIEDIIHVYEKTQGEWIAGYDIDTLVVHLRDAFAYLEKQKEHHIPWYDYQKSKEAGYNQTDEEYDREMDFATSIIEKEHRQPTFSDAINYGIKLQKAKMMENAVEGEVCILPGRAAYVEEKDNESLKQYLLDHFKYGDKVKIIIVKEEEE